MQQTVVSGVAMWSAWQPDRNLFFNSFFVSSPEGNFAVDPLPLPEADAADIASRGGLAWIVVTNRDHERAARALAARFGAKIAAGALDAALLGGPVERQLHDGDTICGARVVALDGLKTPGEFALYFADRRMVIIGDALWGDPAGSLRFMPDQKLADPPRAVLSLRKIWALGAEHLLVGDGACLFGGANRVLGACLEARSDAYVNRIHVDDAVWKAFPGEPPGFEAAVFEVGDHIGAEKLGYRLLRLLPGNASCPLHWHAAEEELFVVMSGRCTLVTPRGDVALRAGDYVAFPTRPDGAHKLVNASDEACDVLMVANTDVRDVCYYPDSHKVLIEDSDLMLRDRPVLDYWDGE